MWTPTTPMYDHQQKAVDKLIKTRVGGLFMDMGTGKTLTAINLIARRQHRIDHVVWFCPVALKLTIADQWKQHAPGVMVYVFDDTTNEQTVPSADVYIIGIESMSSSNRVVLTSNMLITARSFVVVDESSYIKGHRAQRTERITVLSERAQYRLILTGTPLSQGVEDLFAQMRFLSPKILGYRSFYSFAANHLEYSEKHRGMVVRAHNTGMLASKIAPYVYQVRKQDCLDLPKKVYKKTYVDMTSEQRNAYQQAKEEILLSLDLVDFTSYTIYRLFTALQQIVCGFWNRNGVTLSFSHRRLDLFEAVIGGIPSDQRVIVWAKYRRCISELVQLLQVRDGTNSVAQWHGGLNEQQRAAELDHWRKGARYFVATPVTGGHGLTLNEATYTVFYTNSFKYSERLQAEDRNHRIGQTCSTMYLDIITNRSIDERINDALVRKEDILRSFCCKIDQIKDSGKADIRKQLKSLLQNL